MTKKTIYWTMRDGNKINVDKMDINHLRNVLKMLIRHTKKETFILNGDMANQFNECYLSDENDDRFDNYINL